MGEYCTEAQKLAIRVMPRFSLIPDMHRSMTPLISFHIILPVTSGVEGPASAVEALALLMIWSRRGVWSLDYEGRLLQRVGWVS